MEKPRLWAFVGGIWWVLVVVTVSDGSDSERFVRSERHMGTVFRLVFYAHDGVVANEASHAAFQKIAELNDIFSDYSSTSESRSLGDTFSTGENASARQFPVSHDLWRVLVYADRVGQDTSGAFDVTVGPLTKLWRRARRQNRLPSEAAIQDARTSVDYQRLEMLPTKQAVRIKGPGELRLDFGGIAKGYAADAALRVLQQFEITRALVDAGGDLRLGAPPPKKTGWKIVVASTGKPSGEADVGRAAESGKASTSLSLTLHNCGVATSGDAWQYLESAGERYSHIVDPRTGMGLTNRTAATIIAADATTADALASAVSVLGAKSGCTVIESLSGARYPTFYLAGKSVVASGRMVTFDKNFPEPVEYETRGFPELPRSE